MIDPVNKGLGYSDQALDSKTIAQLGWNLLYEDLSLPVAVLYEDKLRHNLEWMQRFVAAYGMKLAPHGKTTMAPRIFEMQLQAGAWGITLATAHQTVAAYSHGVSRVLMANQLVGKENMAMIARLLQDKGFEYYCLVDSAELVEQLGAFFSKCKLRLRVLLEVGVSGGRTGVRDEQQMQAVLAALARWGDWIVLSGIELYEGVLHEEGPVRAFVQRAVNLTRRLASENRFQQTPILLTGAGSAWYDTVAEIFSAAKFGDAVELVLRPGCYVTHDVGAYREAQARVLGKNPIARQMHEGLTPALQVWAYVQSVPEPGTVIIGMGKRDAAFDSGLPVPALHFRPGEASPKPAPAHWKLSKMMDQHAFLKTDDRSEIRVGDMIGFDISHPCLTFDKWRVVPILNSQFQVIDIAQTFF